MIIQHSPRIYPVQQLLSELRRVATSVVRLRFEGPALRQNVSTGWFLTPNIIIVPGFNFQTSRRPELLDKIYVDCEDGWRSTVLDAPELLGFGVMPQAPKNVAALGLLRLRETMLNRVLTWCFDNPTEGDPISLVHFPHGAPTSAVSFGQVKQLADDFLEYDADTMPGSGGAPVLDSSWRVWGMHVAADVRRQVNQGLSRATMLNLLRGSKWWTEIAEFHRLADDAAAQIALRAEPSQTLSATWPSPALIRAAISPRIDPLVLTDDDRKTLSDLVVDDTSEQWVLRPNERQRVIAGAGSLEALKQARLGSAVAASDGMLQRVIDEILEGPPYRIEEASDEALSSWIQASRWFEPVVSGLPTASNIARILARRRIRGKLLELAGPEFQGRKNELGKLHTWYKEKTGPFMLTGIGGIGKSALIAKFACELPSSSLLLWLDFDRPDIAPDNADSVLAAIAEQAAVQLDWLETPATGSGTWQDHARAIGKRLAELTKGKRPPLLVLESFEAAQYTERYQELWPVIEEITRDLTELRVCVTGRAPVHSLQLNGQIAQSLNLTGLPKAEAREWLHSKGVTDPRAVETIVKIARGIPLILKLAFRLVETGGAVTDLPRDLPKRLIAGYLYDRILDRVQNPRFKPVATGMLVLRRLTVDMIAPVLEGLVMFPPGEPDVWFAELSREMGLVEGTSVLLPRREVRSATLWLLERDRRQLVRSVDERAVDWYRSHGAQTAEEIAELVYHLLRIGDIGSADAAWREDCAPYLTFAADDIRGRAARAWLRDHLGDASEATLSLSSWEEDAVKRISAARGRKLDRVVGDILHERPDRSDASPLVFHDAFELRAMGQSAAALEMLEAGDNATGPVRRDRIALRALLEWERGNRHTADELLRRIEASINWRDRTGGMLESLAVMAARIGLTVDLEEEVALLGRSDEMLAPVRQVLSSTDVVSPRLRQRLRPARTLERAPREFDLDQLTFEGARLLECVEEERIAMLEEEPFRLRNLRARLLNEWSAQPTFGPSVVVTSDLGPVDDGDVAAMGIAEGGWQRWWLASTTPFVGAAYKASMSRTSFGDPLMAAVVGTLALFAVRMSTVQLNGRNRPLADAVQNTIFSRSGIQMPAEHWTRTARLLRSCIGPESGWRDFVRIVEEGERVTIYGGDLAYKSPSDMSPEQADVGPFLLFLFSPNPLLQLVHNLAGSAPDLRFEPIGGS